MEDQSINHWEFEPLIIKAISPFIDKYKLVFSNSHNNGIDLKNNNIVISITDRYGEKSVRFSNGKKNIDIGELIFKKYPNYPERIKKDDSIIVFKYRLENFNSYGDYFVYFVKISFDFIEDNYPEIFRGDL